MAKVGCGTYHRSADGYYHTAGAGERKKDKHPKRELSERAVRLAEKRESDAEVCRRCNQKVCMGSARCIEKERERQEKKRRCEENTEGEELCGKTD